MALDAERDSLHAQLDRAAEDAQQTALAQQTREMQLREIHDAAWLERERAQVRALHT